MKTLEQIMGDSYDPEQFWTESGAAYWEPDIPKSPEYIAQEEVLERIAVDLNFTTVLEIGCGGGRVGQLLQRVNPDMVYTGIDISPDALAVASIYIDNGKFIRTSIQDFRPGNRKWDLVVSSEVLMHIKPEEVDDAIAKMKRLGRQILAVEWLPQKTIYKESDIAPWNWPHNYSALGTPVAYTGEQAVYLWP